MNTGTPPPMDGGSTQDHQPQRSEITPDLLWSRYALIQHLIFWLIALAGWYFLHWLGSTQEHLTIPIWRYIARVQSYTFTGDLPGDLILGILSGVLILLFILGSDTLVARFKHKSAKQYIMRNSHLLPQTPRQMFIALLAGTNAGIFEELFFRGGVFTLFLLLLHSTEVAILLTAGIFAVLHAPVQGWYSAGLIFLVGVILNLLLLYSGSYYTPILCH
ncbi:MAG: type II CAAX endopeptidase family protein, partial [Calditrichota bacterium]